MALAFVGLSDGRMLHVLAKETFDYFIHEVNPANGLIRDKTHANWPASIAATGLALSAYPIGVEHGLMGRDAAVNRTLATLRFFRDSPQGTGRYATGYKGFFYHFLDMKTGRRVWDCELSTVDSAYLFAGALAAAVYFDHDNPREREIRDCAETIYRRADWAWAQNGTPRVSLGWKPTTGFDPSYWRGYDESLILQILGLGSPTHPLSVESYRAWTSSYQWKQVYGQPYLYAGPLFIHQFSQIWLDLRGIQDEFMSEKGIDYFENSRRATYIQQQYAIRNPGNWKHYSEYFWGITASDGPGPGTVEIDGVKREFFDYVARGVVDLDLEKFFDRVHDILLSRVARRIGDKRLLLIIRRFLQAGMMQDGCALPATRERHKVDRSPLYWQISCWTTSTSYSKAVTIAFAAMPTIATSMCDHRRRGNG